MIMREKSRNKGTVIFDGTLFFRFIMKIINI